MLINRNSLWASFKFKETLKIFFKEIQNNSYIAIIRIFFVMTARKRSSNTTINSRKKLDR